MVTNMGMKVNSGHFHGTRGLRFLLDLEFFANFPKKDSQIKHIMRNEAGHLIDSKENRALLKMVSNDESNFVGNGEFNTRRYAKVINGKQYRVVTRNNIIQNGGVNEKEVKYIKGKGLKINFKEKK